MNGTEPVQQRQRRLVYGRRKGPKLSAHQENLRGTVLPGLLLVPEIGRAARSYFAAPVDDSATIRAAV